MRAGSRDRRVVSERCVAGWDGCGQVSWTLVHLAATAGPRLTKGHSSDKRQVYGSVC